MRPVLIDADAFICLHGLKLLVPVIASLSRTRTVVLTEIVARQELSALAKLVTDFETKGLITIESLGKKSPAATLFRELRKTNDKGEAESVAWALHATELPLFVTRDVGATKLAESRRVPATDVMGVVVEACEAGGLSRSDAEAALAVWDDKGQQRCRPSPYPGFDSAYAERMEWRRNWEGS